MNIILLLFLVAEPEASPLSQSQTTSSSSATEGPIPGIKENLDPGVKLRTDDQGRPTQTTVYGCCVCSGCSYPKSIVDGTVHDYCSKTCAKKCEWMNQHSSDGGTLYVCIARQFIRKLSSLFCMEEIETDYHDIVCLSFSCPNS